MRAYLSDRIGAVGVWHGEAGTIYSAARPDNNEGWEWVNASPRDAVAEATRILAETEPIRLTRGCRSIYDSCYAHRWYGGYAGKTDVAGLDPQATRALADALRAAIDGGLLDDPGARQ